MIRTKNKKSDSITGHNSISIPMDSLASNNILITITNNNMVISNPSLFVDLINNNNINNNKKKNIRKEKSIKRKENKFVSSDDPKLEKWYKKKFEKFWNEYDKKRGSKKGAYKLFRELLPTEVKQIIKILPDWIEAVAPDWQFRPYPITFLRNNRWEDEIKIIDKKPTHTSTIEKYDDIIGIGNKHGSLLIKVFKNLYKKASRKIHEPKRELSIAYRQLYDDLIYQWDDLYMADDDHKYISMYKVFDGYIDYLISQKWINSITKNLFDIKGTVFSKWLHSFAHRENFNIKTGKYYN